MFSIYIFENSEFDKHQFTKETMTLIHVRNTKKNAFQTDFIFSLKIRQRLYFNTDLYSVHRSSSDNNLPSLTICKSPFFSKGAVVKIFVYVETAGSLLQNSSFLKFNPHIAVLSFLMGGIYYWWLFVSTSTMQL